MSAGRIPCFFVGVALIPLATGTLTNCSSSPPEKSMHHRDSNFVKSAAEIAALEQKAANGDSQAADDLFMHYAFGLRDDAKAEPWLQKAAQLGNPKARRYIEIRSERQ
jgi:hypothetical protein